MKKLGFGCMRLPMIGGPEGEVDLPQFQRMVDAFLAAGFCYFDTAHGYLQGKSETALREGLVKRHPRESYLLADKLTGSYFKTEEDIRPLFQRQLDAVGVEYFDYYLMHSMTVENYTWFQQRNAFQVAEQLKGEGKIRHLGISFHDKPALLERILTDHPEIEVVQIQLNYVDYDDPGVEGGAVYEVCRKFGKSIFVMEPVKGGGLAQLPPAGAAVFSRLGEASPASYALRYAASFQGVEMVLSGMSSYEQLMDNLTFMGDFRPLDKAERAAIEEVKAVLRQENTVPCTACRYCVDGCPKHIAIPELFACLNSHRRYGGFNGAFYYEVSTEGRGKASDCIGCGQCQRSCPQHLEIIHLLKEVAQTFETEEESKK